MREERVVEFNNLILNILTSVSKDGGGGQLLDSEEIDITGVHLVELDYLEGVLHCPRPVLDQYVVRK